VTATDRLVVLHSPSHGFINFVQRGTDPSIIHDLLNDLEIFFDFNDRKSHFQRTINTVITAFPGLNYYVTGHSLGGGVSEDATKNNHYLKTVTFNSISPITK
jgi:alpha-beta hydrolase superfamily lysophospholipase